MRHHRIAGAGLAASVGLAAAAAAVIGWAAPAQADPLPDVGQTVCPMMADSGSTVLSAATEAAGAASAITGKTAPPAGMTEFFSKMALQAYCPAAVTSLSSGKLPGIPGVIDDAPGAVGIFEGGLPGIPGQ